MFGLFYKFDTPALIGKKKGKHIQWEFNKEYPLWIIPRFKKVDSFGIDDKNTAKIKHSYDGESWDTPVSEIVPLVDFLSERTYLNAVGNMKYKDFKYSLTKSIAKDNDIKLSFCTHISGIAVGVPTTDEEQEIHDRIHIACDNLLNKNGGLVIDESKLRENYERVKTITIEGNMGVLDLNLNEMLWDAFVENLKNSDEKDIICEKYEEISNNDCEGIENADLCEELRQICGVV